MLITTNTDGAGPSRLQTSGASRTQVAMQRHSGPRSATTPRNLGRPGRISPRTVRMSCEIPGKRTSLGTVRMHGREMTVRMYTRRSDATDLANVRQAVDRHVA